MACSQNGQIQSEHPLSNWVKSPLNADLPTNLSWQTWQAWGKELVRTGERVGWKMGFWIAYGEDKWPETYVQVIEELGLSQSTVANAKKIVRAFRKVDIQSTVRLPSFWNCDALSNKALDDEERLTLAVEAKKRNLTQKQIKVLVQEYLANKSLASEEPADPSWDDGKFGAGADAMAQELEAEEDEDRTVVFSTESWSDLRTIQKFYRLGSAEEAVERLIRSWMNLRGKREDDAK